MMRFLVLAALLAACKPESARRADRAADEVLEERKELEEAAKKLPDKQDLVAGTKEVLEETGDLAKAARKFELQKSRRMVTLHSIHDLAAMQTGVIGVLARDMQITDAARGEINEKLTRLQVRLDEAGNLIEGLSRVDIDVWKERDSAVTDAMKRLEDARKDAWDALEEAPHIDRSSS